MNRVSSRNLLPVGGGEYTIEGPCGVEINVTSGSMYRKVVGLFFRGRLVPLIMMDAIDSRRRRSAFSYGWFQDGFHALGRDDLGIGLEGSHYHA